MTAPTAAAAGRTPHHPPPGRRSITVGLYDYDADDYEAEHGTPQELDLSGYEER